MLDLKFALSVVHYRTEIYEQPLPAQRALLAGLKAIAKDDGTTPGLTELRNWLEGIISEAEAEDLEPPKRANREVVERQRIGKATYQLELVRCGKERCKKCKLGPSHGPYWYGYQKKGGKLRSWYVGKDLTKELQKEGAAAGDGQTESEATPTVCSTVDRLLASRAD